MNGSQHGSFAWSWTPRTTPGLRFLRALVHALLLLANSYQIAAQTAPPEAPDTIHGTVVSKVTHEPIPHALVVSPDGAFGTMTDSQGRFEFTLPKAEPPKPAVSSSEEGNPAANPTNVLEPGRPNRPNVLSARKPGFLEDNDTAVDLAQSAKEVTLSLVPESIITGQVSLPTSEAPDIVNLQLYRRQVQDGRAHWILAGSTASKSTGEFRFAELHAGTYKLLTQELLDRDPLTFDPRGQLYGYPPVYYQDAADFDSATAIDLAAGDTVQANISLVKQPYYNVKLAVANAPSGVGINVNVSRQGRNGPGHSLAYDAATQTIEGMLPNGVYIVEAIGFGPTPSSGLMILNIKGAAVEGAHMVLVPSSAIAVEVKEEFATGNRAAENPEISTVQMGDRTINLRDPRRYLSLTLESADDFGDGRNAFLRPPKGPKDTSLVIENVQPGRYWVRVQSSRGYAASVRSSTTDLQHDPLVVGTGGTVSPIEITMRDDPATIEGEVEGISPPLNPSVTLQQEPESGERASLAGLAPAHIYCIPLPDSGGEVAEIAVAPDGSFASQPLAPGTYRLLAFDRQQSQLEYRNPEAMKAYDNQGPVVHVAGGQKEHVRLQLITASE